MHAGAVEVVLVLGRLLRLRLDQELPVEADLLLVIDRHVEELGEVIELALHVGVVEVRGSLRGRPRRRSSRRRVPWSLPAPSSPGPRRRRRRRRCSWCAAPCTKRGLLNRLAVPQSSLMPVRCCSSLSTLTTASRLAFVSREVLALRGDVAVVEAVEGHAELLHELEGDVDALDGHLDASRCRLPTAGRRSRGRTDRRPCRGRCASSRPRSAGGPSSTCLRPFRPRCNGGSRAGSSSRGLRT